MLLSRILFGLMLHSQDGFALFIYFVHVSLRVFLCACEHASVLSHRINKDCIPSIPLPFIPVPFHSSSFSKLGKGTPYEEQLSSCTDFAFSLSQGCGLRPCFFSWARNFHQNNFIARSYGLKHKSVDVAFFVKFGICESKFLSTTVSWKYSRELESLCLQS